MTARERYRRADGQSWLELGEGPPVLMLHGIPDCARAWCDVAQPLSDRFRCIAPDLPGFGDSGPAPPIAGLADCAAAVERMVRMAGLSPPLDLVVHDVGGAFGLAWALQDPARVRRLVILNTSFFSDRRWHFGARVLRTPIVGELATRMMPRRRFAAELSRASNRNLGPRAIRLTYERFGSRARQAARQLYRSLSPRVFRGWEDALPELTAAVPTLVAWGLQDPYLPHAFAERFGAWRLRAYDDLGHWPHCEDPERVAGEMAAFLDQDVASSPLRRVAPRS